MRKFVEDIKTKIMVNTQQAQIQLNELKLGVIGIFKQGKSFELVVEEFDNTLNTINITQFGVIQQNFRVPKNYGQVEMFEEGVNMHDMLDNPFEWNNFIKRFK